MTSHSESIFETNKRKIVTLRKHDIRNENKKRECQSDDFSKFQNNIFIGATTANWFLVGKLKVFYDLLIGFTWNFVRLMERYFGNVFTNTHFKTGRNSIRNFVCIFLLELIVYSLPRV